MTSRNVLATPGIQMGKERNTVKWLLLRVQFPVLLPPD